MNEELDEWLGALIDAEDAVDTPADWEGDPLLGLPEEFRFYAEWYNSICDFLEGRFS